jgi:hypothetical protein
VAAHGASGPQDHDGHGHHENGDNHERAGRSPGSDPAEPQQQRYDYRQRDSSEGHSDHRFEKDEKRKPDHQSHPVKGSGLRYEKHCMNW